MLFWNTLKISARSLLANKLRTALAMLGIIIGVASVIAMLAIAAGAQAQVMERVERMGVNLITIRPGEAQHRGRATGRVDILTVEAAEAILNKVPHVARVTPVVQSNSQLSFGNNNTNSSLYGVAPSYLGIRDFSLSGGRIFTDDEVERRSSVGILGAETARELFGPLDPIGQRIRVGRRQVEIVGVLQEMGEMGWFNPDDQLIMPYTTVMSRITGDNYLREISVQTSGREHLPEVEERITALLMNHFNLQPHQDDQFHVRNQADMIEHADAMARTFSFLLGGVASISLLVGGIGIMNIMLVTVTERTREIGVRKAIGGRRRDILRQFLLESIFMCGWGGLFGVVLGAGAAGLIDRLSDFSTIVQPGGIVLALLFAGSIGLFFGYYPARKAAALPPIEALRYE